MKRCEIVGLFNVVVSFVIYDLAAWIIASVDHAVAGKMHILYIGELRKAAVILEMIKDMVESVFLGTLESRVASKTDIFMLDEPALTERITSMTQVVLNGSSDFAFAPALPSNRLGRRMRC